MDTPHLFQPLPPRIRQAKDTRVEYFNIHYQSAYSLTGCGKHHLGGTPSKASNYSPSIPELAKDQHWDKFIESFDTDQARNRRSSVWEDYFAQSYLPQDNEFAEIDGLSRLVVNDLKHEGINDISAYLEKTKNNSAGIQDYSTANRSRDELDDMIQELTQELEHSENLKTRLAFSIQNLLTDFAHLEKFCEAAELRNKPKKIGKFNDFQILNGFLSYCYREKELPTKREVNEEANHWKHSRGHFVEDNEVKLVGKTTLGENKLRYKVISPIYGITKSANSVVSWHCPFEEFNQPLIGSSELTKSLKRLGLQDLKKSPKRKN